MKYRDMEGARTGLVTTDLPVLNLTTDADSYTLKGLYKNWKNAGSSDVSTMIITVNIW